MSSFASFLELIMQRFSLVSHDENTGAVSLQAACAVAEDPASTHTTGFAQTVYSTLPQSPR